MAELIPAWPFVIVPEEYVILKNKEKSSGHHTMYSWEVSIKCAARLMLSVTFSMNPDRGKRTRNDLLNHLRQVRDGELRQRCAMEWENHKPGASLV